MSIWKKILNKSTTALFFLSAAFSVLSLIVIGLYIFYAGFPALREVGLFQFLFGVEWQPRADVYGIGPMILASIYATLGAIVIGVPIGILTAVFLAEVAPPWLCKIVRPGIELLAGIPSVVYGFFGLVVIVPLIDKFFGGGGNSLLAAIIILGIMILLTMVQGQSLLAVILVLTIMILPTIVNISETAIRAVPISYKEGSYALGTSHISTIFRVILPAAKSGVFTSIVLGIGRAIGETMAVILVAGNSPLIPGSLLSRVRTMTANIALEMGYASGLHQNALFATGIILFVFIMLLNVVMTLINSRVEQE